MTQIPIRITVALFIFTGFSCYGKPEIKLSFKMSPAGDFTATSSQVKGEAEAIGGKVTAVNIEVPVKSLDAGMETRTHHMQNKYLQADKFPVIKLVKGSGENGAGTGLLEVKGEAKPISGTYKIEGSEIVAEFKIKISDYKIDKVMYAGLGVKDEVSIIARVPLKTKK